MIIRLPLILTYKIAPIQNSCSYWDLLYSNVFTVCRKSFVTDHNLNSFHGPILLAKKQYDFTVGSKHLFISEDQLVMICLDIFVAGSQTTSNTLDFAFLQMILHPDIQIKVQTCLDAAFRTAKNIDYADRSR